MFIFEDARAHLHTDNQRLHLHKKLKCQELANAVFAFDACKAQLVSGNTNWNANTCRNDHRCPALCKCLPMSEIERKTSDICVR